MLAELTSRGAITTDQAEQGLAERARSGMRLGYCLAALGIASEAAIAGVVGEVMGVQVLELNGHAASGVPDSVAHRVPGTFAHRNFLCPVSSRAGRLVVAMGEPDNLRLVEDLEFIAGMEIEPAAAGEMALLELIERQYPTPEVAVTRLIEELDEVGKPEVRSDPSGPDDRDDLPRGAWVELGDEPAVRFIDEMLESAISRGASDIHIEPYERELRVRYRIDGALQQVSAPPLEMAASLSSRLKIMANLNIAERRLPQDGRIKVTRHDGAVDMRVSTLPTLSGEKIVLRVLDRGTLAMDLGAFGMGRRAEREFMTALEDPHGMVLVTGPTGSGKTTTLYSVLARLNTDGVNIQTAEDPVEYNMTGVNQVQVRPAIGLTFAAALRSFLRQDPDIVLVGEIRDLETASIAVKAALTGHLVLSTLHTNDAASTVTRLVDMGVEPFNAAAAINLVTAQRLVRCVCGNCSRETRYLPRALREAGMDPAEASGARFRRGAGCDACGLTGFSGRRGLYEVMPMSRAIRQLALDRAPAHRIKERAVEEGMVTLRRDGLKKAVRGTTTLEEVLRVTSA